MIKIDILLEFAEFRFDKRPRNGSLLNCPYSRAVIFQQRQECLAIQCDNLGKRPFTVIADLVIDAKYRGHLSFSRFRRATRALHNSYSGELAKIRADRVAGRTRPGQRHDAENAMMRESRIHRLLRNARKG